MSIKWLPEGLKHTEYLIDAATVIQAYENELRGVYDEKLLDYILIYFHGRFRWYATEVKFHDNPELNKKVQANYRKRQVRIENTMLASAREKMLLIDHLIDIQHHSGNFAMKLIGDFKVFIHKRRLLETKYQQRVKDVDEKLDVQIDGVHSKCTSKKIDPNTYEIFLKGPKKISLGFIRITREISKFDPVIEIFIWDIDKNLQPYGRLPVGKKDGATYFDETLIPVAQWQAQELLFKRYKDDTKS